MNKVYETGIEPAIENYATPPESLVEVTGNCYPA